MMLALELIWVSCCRKSILMTRKKSSGTATLIVQEHSSNLPDYSVMRIHEIGVFCSFGSYSDCHSEMNGIVFRSRIDGIDGIAVCSE